MVHMNFGKSRGWCIFIAYIYVYIYIYIIAIKMKGIIIPNSSSRAHLKKGIKPIFNSKRLNSRPNFVKYA